LFCETTLVPPIAERTITGPEWNSYAVPLPREASTFPTSCCKNSQKISAASTTGTDGRRPQHRQGALRATFAFHLQFVFVELFACPAASKHDGHHHQMAPTGELRTDQLMTLVAKAASHLDDELRRTVTIMQHGFDREKAFSVLR
jgi:hypothetical protein